jgi:hypothetical protein
VVEAAVRACDMLGKTAVLERLCDIYHRYVANVDTPTFPILHGLT